jgi:CRP/FNR family nitrogen fixation transcriptional regulator
MFIQTDFRHPSATATACRFDTEVSALVAQSRPAAVTFHKAGEVIYAQGEAAGPLYLVEFGTVRICRLTADGRRQISAFHFAGEVFGFEAGSEHQSYAEAVDGTGIRVLRPNTGNGYGAGVLSLALRSLARAQDHLVLLGRMSATERMAAFLLDLRERQGDNLVNLAMQRNDIGDYLGLTFETVSRVLRVLKDDKVIRLTRVDQVAILNPEALEALCD